MGFSKNERDAFSTRKFGAFSRELPSCNDRENEDRTDEVMKVHREVIFWRRSSVGQSTRFIPVASLVQIQSPLPFRNERFTNLSVTLNNLN